MTPPIRLTPEQQAAVDSTLPVTVISAAPGAGKTEVLAARAARLIAEGVDPQTILALVFTRAAAQNLKARIAFWVGWPATKAATICTIHALAAQLGLEPGEAVATLEEDAETIRGLYDGPTRRRDRGFPGITRLEAAIARHAAGLGLDDEAEVLAVHLLLHRHAAERRAPLWNLLPRALARPDQARALYRHVLVDEAMDLTPAEVAFVDLVRHPDGTLTAVLDPRQAIFGWRHAVGFPLPVTHRIAGSLRFGDRIAYEANLVAERMGKEPIVGLGEPHRLVMETSRLDTLLEVVGRDPANTLVLARIHKRWSPKAEMPSCEDLATMLGDLAVHIQPEPRDPLSAEADRFAVARGAGRAVVTTVHAIKGAEADTVVLALDDPGEDLEELRVHYVARTRARRRLIYWRGGWR